MLRQCTVQRTLLEKLAQGLSKDQGYLTRYVNKKNFGLSDDYWTSGDHGIALSFLRKYMQGCHRNKRKVRSEVEYLFNRYNIKFNLKESGWYDDEDKDCLEYYNDEYGECYTYYQIEID